MTTTLTASEVERFRSAVAAGMGIAFDDGRLAQLAEVLARRTAATGEGAGRYLERLASLPMPREELRQLAEELTVPETYFFRHGEQFQAVAEAALPERLSAHGPSGPLRLLSAGCASGEEAWSLAILVTERGLPPGYPAFIDAVDINPAMLKRARGTRYSSWSLREVSPELKARWFRAEGRELVLSRPLPVQVTFEEHNLVLAPGEFDPWPVGAYDVVFCRNVLMYFSPERAQSVVDRFTRALAPGGYLFLGYAETLRGLSVDYDLRHTHGTFYYQRKARPRFAAPRVTATGRGVTPVAGIAVWPPTDGGMPAVSAEATGGANWVDAVARASARIKQLSDEVAGERAVVPPAPAASPDMRQAVDLLRQERFAEALALLGEPASAGPADPDVALLRAALLTHTGSLVQAERVCLDLLAQDDLSAGAHYLLALCREAGGDREGARDHQQTAIHLDPTFAMPRLHLGLMARREGKRTAAAEELRRAALLLPREDPSRVLLFGGGFGREGLLALCRAELDRLGEQP